MTAAIVKKVSKYLVTRDSDRDSVYICVSSQEPNVPIEFTLVCITCDVSINHYLPSSSDWLIARKGEFSRIMASTATAIATEARTNRMGS